MGRGGAFLVVDLADAFEVIDLDVQFTVQLSKLVLRDMTAHDEGRVLITSSIASTMPGPAGIAPGEGPPPDGRAAGLGMTR